MFFSKQKKFIGDGWINPPRTQHLQATGETTTKILFLIVKYSANIQGSPMIFHKIAPSVDYNKGLIRLLLKLIKQQIKIPQSC